MTASRFESVVPNPDLDILPEPSGLWAHVAVVGGWKDKSAIRKARPLAAVVGPLRTLRGIDLLVRGLLANPQIQIVIWDGPDLTPGEATSKAFWNLWEGQGPGLEPLAADVAAEWRKIAAFLNPIDGGILRSRGEGGSHPFAPLDRTTQEDYLVHFTLGDEEGRERVVLLPPAPVSGDTAPAGDPGQRVVGDTLADVWPLVLREVMLAGREVPTQYGETKELLALTSVTPDGATVLRFFEAKTALALRGQIERSGLITSVGSALWLGAELVKAERKL